MKLPEGAMVSLAWAGGLQIFGWCISAGEDGCTLEKGTLNPIAEWMDVSPGLNWALSCGRRQTGSNGILLPAEGSIGSQQRQNPAFLR